VPGRQNRAFTDNRTGTGSEGASAQFEDKLYERRVPRLDPISEYNRFCFRPLRERLRSAHTHEDSKHEQNVCEWTDARHDQTYRSTTLRPLVMTQSEPEMLGT